MSSSLLLVDVISTTLVNHINLCSLFLFCHIFITFVITIVFVGKWLVRYNENLNPYNHIENFGDKTSCCYRTKNFGIQKIHIDIIIKFDFFEIHKYCWYISFHTKIFVYYFVLKFIYNISMHFKIIFNLFTNVSKYRYFSINSYIIKYQIFWYISLPYRNFFIVYHCPVNLFLFGPVKLFLFYYLNFCIV